MLRMGAGIKSLCPRRESIRKIFVSGYQLEIAPGLGMGLVSASPFSAGSPSGTGT